LRFTARHVTTNTLLTTQNACIKPQILLRVLQTLSNKTKRTRVFFNCLKQFGKYRFSSDLKVLFYYTHYLHSKTCTVIPVVLLWAIYRNCLACYMLPPRGGTRWERPSSSASGYEAAKKRIQSRLTLIPV